MNKKIILLLQLLSGHVLYAGQAASSPTATPSSEKPASADLKDWSKEKKRSELIKAAETNEVALFEQMIQASFDLMVRDIQGFTPLAIAVVKNHPEIVKLLLAAKVDLEAEDNYSRTPLSWAAIKENIPLLEMLVHAGAWVDYKNKQAGKTALMLAAEYKKFESVKKLIENHAQIDLQDKKGMTALMWAAKAGNSDSINYLKKHHADTKIKDEKGKTYLDHWRETLRQNKLTKQAKKNHKMPETIQEEVQDEQNS